MAFIFCASTSTQATMASYMIFTIGLCIMAAVMPMSDAADPCEVNYTSSGNISSKTNSTACNYVIIKNSSSPGVKLQISYMILKENETVRILDGNQTIVEYNATTQSVDNPILYGFENVTVFRSSYSNKSQWLLWFDPDGCKMNVTNTWITSVDSPFYLKTAKQLECSYTVYSDGLPSDLIAAASVSQFNLTGKSILVVSSGDSQVTYTGLTQDDFFADKSAPLVLELTIPDASNFTSFSLRVDPVHGDCSGNTTLSKPFTWPKIPTLSGSYECRYLLKAEGKSKILANVNSLKFASVNDRLTLFDGSSSERNVLSTPSPSADGLLFTGSKNTMLASLVLGSTDGSRNIDITFTEVADGGLLIENGPLSIYNKLDNSTVYYQLIAASGQVVRVDVSSLLPPNATVTFYDGLQKSGRKLVVCRDACFVIGGSNMLVELVGFQPNSIFSASFTSIQPGCDLLATKASDTLSYPAQSKGNCTWTIAPQDVKGTIVIDINTLSLGENETVSVFEKSDKRVATFNGPAASSKFIPEIYVDVAARIVISGTAPRVALVYNTLPREPVCGGTLKQADSIATPNYPNQYPFNAYCSWAPNDTSSDEYLYLNFQYLDLADKHFITVFDGDKSVKYGGRNNLPGDTVVKVTNKTSVQFSSTQGNIEVGGGAYIKTETLGCGGSLSSSDSSFQTPGYPKPLSEPTKCIWIIGLNNTTTIVNFTINSNSTNVTDIEPYLTIFDGNSRRSGLLHFNSSKEDYFLSRTDGLVVVLDYKEKDDKPAIQFSFNFTAYVCKKKCQNGICMHPDWICDHVNDCGDNTDELDCNNSTTTVPPPTTTTMPTPQDYSGWVKSGWVPACLFIGLLIGAVLVFAVPRIIRRFRPGSGGHYSRMGDNDSTT